MDPIKPVAKVGAEPEGPGEPRIRITPHVQDGGSPDKVCASCQWLPPGGVASVGLCAKLP
jgi:hypothetical protein